MTSLLGLSGSLRAGSLNSALLRAAAELAPPGTTLALDTIAGIPLYDGDLEAEQGVPAPVRALKDRIAACDGLVLATPEYNTSLPGVLKNAIDWLSRPNTDIPRVFGAKPVALMGASPGRGGTLSAQTAWLPVLRTLGTNPWFGARLMLASAHELFDEDGRLTDERTRKQVQAFVAGFAEFAARGRR